MALWYLQVDNRIRLEGAETEGVILSPSLYWYAHARFPTRSLSKAKRLADAWLDTRPAEYDTLYVERREEGFDCFAYSARLIRQKLEEAGMAETTPVWFLQQWAPYLPFRLDDSTAVTLVNGIALELPADTVAAKPLASIPADTLPTPLNRPQKGWASQKVAAVFLLLLALTALSDIALRIQTWYALEKAVEATRTDRSLYEIKALVRRYEQRDEKAKALRKALAEALHPPLQRLVCHPEKGCVRE